MGKNNDFLDLLISNDEKEIKNFVVSNGKAPKPVAAIRFIEKDTIEETNQTELRSLNND